MTILLVEDEPLVVEEILAKLENLGYSKVHSTDNVKDALLKVNEVKPDVVIIDIELKGSENGIHLGGELSKVGIPFIYLSSLQEIPIFDRAKKTQPFTNIPKPVSLLQLRNSLLELENSEPQTNVTNKLLVVSRNGKKILVEPKEIVFLKAARSQCEIHLEKKYHVSSTPMNNVLANLGEEFMQVHRSYSVNMRFVSGYEGNMIYTLSDFDALPIGESYRADFVGKFEVL